MVESMERPKSVFKTHRDPVTGERIASICSYCSDVKEGTLWATDNGFIDSHGTCSACLTSHFPTLPADIIERQKLNEGIFLDLTHE